MPYSNDITKDNIDHYLYELAKQVKKMYKPTERLELILVGGASVLVNYGFRESTQDIDALMSSAALIKDASIIVGEKFGLPKNWINTDFVRTASFTPKLYEHASYYKTFCNCIEVRTIKEEYLIAMKLCSGRQYKHDLSDITGIIHERKISEEPIDLKSIQDAYTELYGPWEELSLELRTYMEEDVFSDKEDTSKIFQETKEKEEAVSDALHKFEDKYPNVLFEDNIDDFIRKLELETNETEVDHDAPDYDDYNDWSDFER